MSSHKEGQPAKKWLTRFRNRCPICGHKPVGFHRFPQHIRRVWDLTTLEYGPYPRPDFRLTCGPHIWVTEVPTARELDDQRRMVEYWKDRMRCVFARAWDADEGGDPERSEQLEAQLTACYRHRAEEEAKLAEMTFTVENTHASVSQEGGA